MVLAHSRRPSMAGSEASAGITSCDSFGGQYRYDPSPNILNVFPTISCFFTIAFQE